MKSSLLCLGLAAMLAACTTSETTGQVDETLTRLCPQAELCAIGTHWNDHACRCVGDGGENCGDTRCHGTDYCCAGGPINIDPTLNHYFCVDAGSFCPL